MTGERKCPECNVIIKGRQDKKYCSDHCRSHANYIVKRVGDEHIINIIDTALKNNRKILLQLSIGGKKMVKKELLMAKGFNFKHYTTIVHLPAGGLCFYCYDVGYSFINNSDIILVKSRH